MEATNQWVSRRRRRNSSSWPTGQRGVRLGAGEQLTDRDATKRDEDRGHGHLFDDCPNLVGRVRVAPEIELDLQVGEERRCPVVERQDVEESSEATFERRAVDRARPGEFREFALTLFEDREEQPLTRSEVVLDHAPAHTGATRARVALSASLRCPARPRATKRR
jgi:hypothetical protein